MALVLGTTWTARRLNQSGVAILNPVTTGRVNTCIGDNLEIEFPVTATGVDALTNREYSLRFLPFTQTASSPSNIGSVGWVAKTSATIGAYPMAMMAADPGVKSQNRNFFATLTLASAVAGFITFRFVVTSENQDWIPASFNMRNRLLSSHNSAAYMYHQDGAYTDGASNLAITVNTRALSSLPFASFATAVGDTVLNVPMTERWFHRDPLNTFWQYRVADFTVNVGSSSNPIARKQPSGDTGYKRAHDSNYIETGNKLSFFEDNQVSFLLNRSGGLAPTNVVAHILRTDGTNQGNTIQGFYGADFSSNFLGAMLPVGSNNTSAFVGGSAYVAGPTNTALVGTTQFRVSFRIPKGRLTACSTYRIVLLIYANGTPPTVYPVVSNELFCDHFPDITTNSRIWLTDPFRKVETDAAFVAPHVPLKSEAIFSLDDITAAFIYYGINNTGINALRYLRADVDNSPTTSGAFDANENIFLWQRGPGLVKGEMPTFSLSQIEGRGIIGPLDEEIASQDVATLGLSGRVVRWELGIETQQNCGETVLIKMRRYQRITRKPFEQEGGAGYVNGLSMAVYDGDQPLSAQAPILATCDTGSAWVEVSKLLPLSGIDTDFIGEVYRESQTVGITTSALIEQERSVFAGNFPASNTPKIFAADTEFDTNLNESSAEKASFKVDISTLSEGDTYWAAGIARPKVPSVCPLIPAPTSTLTFNRTGTLVLVDVNFSAFRSAFNTATATTSSPSIFRLLNAATGTTSGVSAGPANPSFIAFTIEQSANNVNKVRVQYVIEAIANIGGILRVVRYEVDKSIDVPPPIAGSTVVVTLTALDFKCLDYAS